MKCKRLKWQSSLFLIPKYFRIDRKLKFAKYEVLLMPICHSAHSSEQVGHCVCKAFPAALCLRWCVNTSVQILQTPVALKAASFPFFTVSLLYCWLWNACWYLDPTFPMASRATGLVYFTLSFLATSDRQGKAAWDFQRQYSAYEVLSVLAFY